VHVAPGDSRSPKPSSLTYPVADKHHSAQRPCDCKQCFRRLAEVAGQLVYDWDAVSGRIEWGGAVSDVTGYTSAEIEHVNAEAWQEMIHPDDRSAAACARAEALRAAQSYCLEYRVRRKDDAYVYVEDHGVLLRNDAGEVVRILGLLTNVSERRELEQQLAQARKMEAVGQLAGGVAHDFNNIVSIIMCCAEQALRLCAPEAPEGAPLRQILKASTRAAALTRQLLAFSRKGTASPVVANLNNVVKESHSMLRRLIGEDIALVLDLDPELEQTLVDPGQIQQVLLNLAVNARDAMPAGGKLTLQTANVRVETEGDDPSTAKRVLLRVADTGHGMSPEIRSHVFEPFFTTKPEGQGTGLGLATVHSIVQQSGGTIELESTVGVGTTFSIYFAPSQGTAVVPVAAEAPVSAGGSETILLVEDEAELLQILKAGLERRGYTVLAASCGKDALDLSRGHAETIDLVVADVIMPGMSGYELVTQLLSERRGLSALYLSGHTADFMARKGLHIEGTDLLVKPFTDAALQERIRRILDRTRTGAATD
jgi:two-component system cell cycle sensor histidine kinase/response regulator CckA